ncbi:hypothetical protein [Ktedonobacter racemifer]|nr:hypothetical protein [Ktedonobacter racemifer]
MARKHCRPPATREKRLETIQQFCSACGKRLYAAYHTARTVTTLAGMYRLTLQVRHCRNPNCVRYQVSYRPEEEGAWGRNCARERQIRSTSPEELLDPHQAE